MNGKINHMTNHMQKPTMKLVEETGLSKGTELYSKRFGKCRVHFVYDDKISVIIGDKKIGSTGDAWMRLIDGKIIEWNSDDEVHIE